MEKYLTLDIDATVSTVDTLVKKAEKALEPRLRDVNNILISVKEGLSKLEIDQIGLEKYDREILLSIINNFGGGPVGAETLAISIGENIDTLEDYYEPYLIQCGFLQRTPRGRIVTQKAYEHLGLKANNENNTEQNNLFS